jgi:aspartate aminotransferase
MIAERMNHIAPSATLKVGIEANALRRQGADLVDFGQGEPDFPTPDHVKAAARAAIDADFTRYTPAAGVLELRQALCAHYERLYSTHFEPSQTLVSAGGKQALFNVMLALVNPGDEIVTHTPGWPSIPEQVKLMGGTPVLVECRADDGFAIHAGPILDALTPKTKAIVINSPCNPTGALITEEELTAICDAAAQRGTWVVADLCYEQIVYDPVPHNLPKVLMSRVSNLAVLAGSCSKSYAMTGWRCGWAIGPAPLIQACEAIQGHSTSNVTSVTQRAAIAALSGSQEPSQAMIREYRRRRDAAHALFTADPRVRCSKPGGAFYLLLDVRDLLKSAGISSSAAFAESLLHEAYVVVTAGEAFNAPGYIRISYATSVDRIQEGAKRFHKFVDRLSADRVR